jgi:hypothetical protein
MSDLQAIADRVEIERLAEGLWDYLVQTTHPGTIQLEGDTASGRAYVIKYLDTTPLAGSSPQKTTTTGDTPRGLDSDGDNR